MSCNLEAGLERESRVPRAHGGITDDPKEAKVGNLISLIPTSKLVPGRMMRLFLNETLFPPNSVDQHPNFPNVISPPSWLVVPAENATSAEKA